MRILGPVLLAVTIAGCVRHTVLPANPARAVFAEDKEAIRRVSLGMTQLEVERLLGPPCAIDARTSWRAFVPFYLGSDHWRMVFDYGDRGTVTLSYGGINRDGTVIDVKPGKER
jgi:hypothetical protein